MAMSKSHDPDSERRGGWRRRRVRCPGARDENRNEQKQRSQSVKQLHGRILSIGGPFGPTSGNIGSSFHVVAYHRLRGSQLPLTADAQTHTAVHRLLAICGRTPARVLAAGSPGLPPPWTNDAVPAAYKFTDAYRASDRVSQRLIHRVVQGQWQKCFAAVGGRSDRRWARPQAWVNDIATRRKHREPEVLCCVQ